MSSIYQNYQDEIYYLQQHGDILLQRIKHLEIKMNQRRQQKLLPTERHIKTMHNWVIKLLKILAYIKTYQFFQARNILLTDVNTNWFFHIVNNKYLVLFQQFMSRLHEIQSVDFTVTPIKIIKRC